MKRTIYAAMLLASTALATLPAQADVVLGGVTFATAGADQLTLTAVVPGGNQPQNVQCIICGANQPQQSPTFGYTDFGNQGNQTTEAYFSSNILGGGNPGSNTIAAVNYTDGFLRNYLVSVGDPSLGFTIGVDVNDTNQAQTLTSFYMLNLTQHTVLAVFNTPTSVPSQNNGTGFPDYTLSGFDLNRGDIQLGDNIAFFARIDGANDGPDSFFIQPAAAVPGPVVGAGPIGLAAAGLFGLNFWRRRRNGGTLQA